MEPLTLLIADDHPLFRTGLRALLASMPEVDLLGEATNGAEAVRMAEALQPDVVLLDLQMPEGGGLPAIRQIVQTSPHIRILVVTMLQDDDSVFAAMRAGARGYVLKDSYDEDIRRAILAVGNGEAIFSPAIAARMMRFFAASRPGVQRDASRSGPTNSSRSPATSENSGAVRKKRSGAAKGGALSNESSACIRPPDQRQIRISKVPSPTSSVS